MSQKGFSKPRTRGVASVRGTIWILVIVALVVAAGVLVWQWEKMSKEKGLNEELLREKTAEKQEAERGLNYKDMISQMFPKKEFKEVREKYFEDKEGNVFYIEKLLEDSFVQPNEKNILLVVRQESPLAHVTGFYHAYLAAFDNKSKEILTDTIALAAGDTGNISFFRDSKGQVFILFNSTVTYQGWTDCGIELFFVEANTFKKALWPIGGFAEDVCFEIKENKITILERNILGRQGESVIPEYKWEPSYDLYWNPESARFELEIRNWKLYQNKKYNFEVKYPQEESAPKIDLFREFTVYPGPDPEGKGYTISGEVTIKFGNITIDILPENMEENLKKIVTIRTAEEILAKEIVVNKIKCNLIRVKEGAQVWFYAKEVMGEGGKCSLILDRSEDGFPQIWLKKNQKLYIIKGRGPIFDQMLSTFRFLE